MTLLSRGNPRIRPESKPGPLITRRAAFYAGAPSGTRATRDPASSSCACDIKVLRQGNTDPRWVTIKNLSLVNRESPRNSTPSCGSQSQNENYRTRWEGHSQGVIHNPVFDDTMCVGDVALLLHPCKGWNWKL